VLNPVLSRVVNLVQGGPVVRQVPRGLLLQDRQLDLVLGRQVLRHVLQRLLQSLESLRVPHCPPAIADHCRGQHTELRVPWVRGASAQAARRAHGPGSRYVRNSQVKGELLRRVLEEVRA